MSHIHIFYRFFAKDIRKAAQDIRSEFDESIMGKVALSIFLHHNASAVTYALCESAQEYFDKIIDNLAMQFNCHYDQVDTLTDSQPTLDSQQRADIDVRTKAAELMGRLACVLWIYCNGKC